jgi:hypothetical protein
LIVGGSGAAPAYSPYRGKRGYINLDFYVKLAYPPFTLQKGGAAAWGVYPHAAKKATLFIYKKFFKSFYSEYKKIKDFFIPSPVELFLKGGFSFISAQTRSEGESVARPRVISCFICPLRITLIPPDSYSLNLD